MSWQTRSNGLIVTDVDEDLVVYDRDRQAIHTLNPVAAAVWRQCNGTMAEDEMAAWLDLSSDTIATAIRLLHDAALITGAAGNDPRPYTSSRRRAIRQAGIALPAIVSISAPQAHAAHSECPGAIPSGECVDNEGVDCLKPSGACGTCTKTVTPPAPGCLICVEGIAWSCS